jgi:uncharacterized lipoprotein YddW (UPF0748 family)
MQDSLKPLRSTDQPSLPEIRAAWVDAWHEGLLSAGQVSQLVSTLKAANYNLILAQVRKSGDAYYRSSYEPRASNIADGADFDPLADLLAKAHAAGLQVYAWLETYRIWSDQWPAPPAGHVWSRHPEWALKDRTGQVLAEGHYNLDPGVPGVQDYICGVACDLVQQYDLDGINWDRIRYPESYYWGYNDITATRFFDEYGYWPPEHRCDPAWEVWADYRRRQITDLLKKCYLELAARKPRLAVSVDTIAWLDPDPAAHYTSSSQFAAVYQDARGWLAAHLVDMLVQMNYKAESVPQQAASYRLWSDFAGQLACASGRYCVDGQAAYLNSITGTVAQMAYARGGCQGAATYSYASTDCEGRPATEFWDTVRSQVYPSPAAGPAMPWKQSPTSGILFGTLTRSGTPDQIYGSWVYGATMTATAAAEPGRPAIVGAAGQAAGSSGSAAGKGQEYPASGEGKAPVTTGGPAPSALSARSDATGTYGFIDLPPGTYDLEIAAPGQVPLACPGVTIRAGDVVRRDFRLEAATW